jgi:hypothetical protein
VQRLSDAGRGESAVNLEQGGYGAALFSREPEAWRLPGRRELSPVADYDPAWLHELSDQMPRSPLDLMRAGALAEDNQSQRLVPHAPAARLSGFCICPVVKEGPHPDQPSSVSAR